MPKRAKGVFGFAESSVTQTHRDMDPTVHLARHSESLSQKKAHMSAKPPLLKFLGPREAGTLIFKIRSWFTRSDLTARDRILKIITFLAFLRQMLETFESNLSDSQKEEIANQKAYDDLKQAKEAEISAGTAQIDSKTEELATTDEKNAQAKVQYLWE